MKTILFGAGLLGIVATLLLFATFPQLNPVSVKTNNDRDCWPIPHDLAPGSIRCWSGGELVYENSIYHNGGVLCSIEGKEIKITGGKSLCVIESNQDSAWEPPIATDTKR